jgi:hypothetical protein
MKKQYTKVDGLKPKTSQQLCLNFSATKDSQKGHCEAKIINIRVNTDRQRQYLISDIIRNTKSF